MARRCSISRRHFSCALEVVLDRVRLGWDDICLERSSSSSIRYFELRSQGCSLVRCEAMSSAL